MLGGVESGERAGPSWSLRKGKVIGVGRNQAGEKDQRYVYIDPRL